MKLLVVINSPLFDACLPLLKRLRDKCELSCLFEVYPESTNQMEIGVECFGSRKVIQGTEVPVLQKYSDYFPLSNTKIIRFYRPSQLPKHLLMMKTLKKTIEGFNPDYVYFYNVPYSSLMFVYSSHIPWAMAVHDPQLHSSQDNAGYYKIMRRIIFRKCKHFFLFSNNLIDGFVKYYGLPRENVHLTRLGAYEQLSQSSDKTEIHDGLRILFFGSVNSYKGLRYLLEAYKKLKQKGFMDVFLTVLGKGYIENDIIDLNTEGLTIINRFYSAEELESELNKSDLVVCPYTDATQSGVVMSAYAFNKPCLVTNVGGLTEMVCHMENGFIVNPSDSAALYEAIVYIRNNKEVTKKWSENIQKKYGEEGECGWNQIANNLISDFNKILNYANRD